jgi:prolyl 4-hydroxylase
MHWSEHLISQLDAWLKPAHEQATLLEAEAQLTPEALVEACKAHQYTSEIISLDPLVIYINNFTSAPEAEELINIGCVPPHFPSPSFPIHITQTHFP